MNKIFQKMTAKFLLTVGLLLCSGLSFGATVRCDGGTWSDFGTPVVSTTASEIRITYVFLANNDMKPGDTCMLTHLGNQTPKVNILSDDGKNTVLLGVSTFEFGRVPNQPVFCYGTNPTGSTSCSNGAAVFVAPGTVSYRIPSNLVGSLYDFTYIYKGKVSSNWKMCPEIEVVSSGGGCFGCAVSRKLLATCAKGAPTAPTCSLTVPSTLKVPTVTLNDFNLTGVRGTNKEAKGSSFNIRINCTAANSSFTPTVTFSYSEGVFCMPGNGATPATAAQNIGFAIKTSVTSSNISEYICGQSGGGRTNVVSFPATTANAIYDQSKTFFVNYAIQNLSVADAGFVQTNVTLTSIFP
jgi:hypothetical protein